MIKFIFASIVFISAVTFYSSRPAHVATIHRLLTAGGRDSVEATNDASSQRELWYVLQEVGNNGKPEEMYPLSQCRGDCDNNNECEKGLKCFQRGGNGDAPSDAPVPGCYGDSRAGVDFCIDPADLPDDDGNSPTNSPGPPGSPTSRPTSRPTSQPTTKDSNPTPQPTQRPTQQPTTKNSPTGPAPSPGPQGNLVQIGNNGSPASVYPLRECQGDCDNDYECVGSLKCFQRKTGDTRSIPGCYGQPFKGTDYCYNPFPNQPTPNPYYPPPTPNPYYPPPTRTPYYPPPTPYPQPTGGGGYLAEVGNNGKPPNVFPLQKCQGDCDNDYECGYGLKCFQRKGHETVPGCYGWARAGIDFCISAYDSKPKPKPKPTPYPYYPKPTPYPYYPKPTPYPYYPKPTPYPYYPKPTPYPYYPPPTPKPTPYYTHTQEPSMTDVPTKGHSQWTFHE